MDGYEKQELIVESLGNSKLNLNSPNSFRIRTKRERKRKKPGTVVLPQAIRSAAVVRRPSSTKYWPLSADNCSLECLPVTVLCDVAACLDISDQNNFAYSCHKAREAVKLFWRSRRNVSVSSILVRQFPRVDEWKWTSLHNVLDEVAIALRLIPSHSISSLDVRPFYKLHIDDLNLLAIRAQKSPYEMFGFIQHLDIRGCTLHTAEMLWFSVACPNLLSLAITASCVEIEERVSVDATALDFLRTSLLGYSALKRAKQLQSNQLQLVFYLLKLFPLLEKIHIE